MANLNSIHHTARCGSTFLVSLLSSAAPAYAEPPWGIPLWAEGLDIPPARDGAVVKFQSIGIFHKIPDGKRVFLYRPLAQHLAKYKTLPSAWLSPRLSMIRKYINDVDFKGTTQAFALFWAKQVQIAIEANCMMVESNMLFHTPEETASQVLAFFGIDGRPDLRFVDVDVKALQLIGQSDPIVFPARKPASRVASGHGVFTTEAAMSDASIKDAVEWVEECFPSVAAFTR